MLETIGSRNMVSIVNSVCSLKEYCLPLSVFLDEPPHLCAESPHSSEREKHCNSCKRIIDITSKSVLHLVKHGELSYLLKGMLPYCQCFHGRGTLQFSIKSIPENGGSPVALVRQPLII
jgi:hypothetical protein